MKKILMLLGRNVFVVGLLLILLDLVSVVNVHRFVNMNVFLSATVFFGVMGYILWWNALALKKRMINEIMKWLFLLFLVLITFSSLNWSCISSVSVFLRHEQFLLMIFCIGLSVVVFYVNNDMIDSLEKDRQDEDKAEVQRNKNFASRYPKIARIPLLRNILKLMYTEGWLYSVLLILILLNAFFIRIDNLGAYPFQNDEYSTLNVAKGFAETGQFKSWDFAENALSNTTYTRAWPNILFTSLFVKFFDSSSESVVRSPSIIVGFLTLFFFYWLMRKIKFRKIVSLTAVFCFSVYDLFVWHSRTARMYNLVLLLFFTGFYYSYQIIKKLDKSGNVIDFFRANKLNMFFYLLLLVFNFIIHPVTVLYIVPMGIYALYKSFSSKNLRIIIWPAAVFSAIFLLLDLTLNLGLLGHEYLLQFNIFNPKLSYLIYSYSSLAGGFATLLFFFIPLILLIMSKKPNMNIGFVYLGYLSVLFGYVFLSKERFTDPRYGIFLWPMFILGVLLGIYFVLKLFKLGRFRNVLFFVVSAVLVLNIQIAGVCIDNIVMNCPISHENEMYEYSRWNYPYDEVYSFVSNYTSGNEIIIGMGLRTYYLSKYNITNPVFHLRSYDKKYSFDEIKDADLIYILSDIHYNQKKDINVQHQEIKKYLNAAEKELIYQDEKFRVFLINSKIVQ